MRPSSPSLPEKEFLLSSLSQGLRIDGRATLQARRTSLVFPQGSSGSAEATIGKTRALAHVRPEMVRPPVERPLEGLLTIHAELSPMAGEEHDTLRPSDAEIALNRNLERALRRSGAVDREALCIVAGERVWHIHLHVHILSDAGGMSECAVLAAGAALRRARLPDLEVVGNSVEVHPERVPRPLALAHTPLLFTFVFFPLLASAPLAAARPKSFTAHLATAASQDPKSEDEEQAMSATDDRPTCLALLDPSPMETALAPARLTIGLTRAKEIVLLGTSAPPLTSSTHSIYLQIARQSKKGENGSIPGAGGGRLGGALDPSDVLWAVKEASRRVALEEAWMRSEVAQSVGVEGAY